MQYFAVAGTHGICPFGWHIPTDTEQDTLDQSQNNTTCSSSCTAYACADAGTKLKFGGTSGFNGELAGYRSSVGGTFDAKGISGTFWSSANSGGNNFWTKDLSISQTTTVGRFYNNRVYGFSASCLKD